MSALHFLMSLINQFWGLCTSVVSQNIPASRQGLPPVHFVFPVSGNETGEEQRVMTRALRAASPELATLLCPSAPACAWVWLLTSLNQLLSL